MNRLPEFRLLYAILKKIIPSKIVNTVYTCVDFAPTILGLMGVKQILVCKRVSMMPRHLQTRKRMSNKTE